MRDGIFAQRTLKEYLEAAGSGDPTPGGGSVAALTGALAASMASMVARFTTGRKKYAAVQQDMDFIVRTLDEEGSRLLALVDEDVRVYEGVSVAFRLPADTEEEKAKKASAVAEACKDASVVPMEVARLSLKVARSADRLAEMGNKNLISDAGVAALLCLAAAQSAAMNVEINLVNVPDPAFREAARKGLKEVLREVESLRDRVWENVRKDLAFDEGSVLL